eukprot:XP_011245240.1 PREDICTED: uncharacterized protein LOC271508 isoform X1 [Mus musculus]
MCLQAGCEWVWLDSGQDSHDDSELSNDCRSLLSSWDSSLDLDVGSWKDTEDAEAEADEPKESSPERGCSELLVGDVESEEAREEAEQGTPQELLSEGEAQQDSKEDDQGEGSASDGEDTPPLGEGEGIRVQEAPLVNILYSSSQLNDLSQGDPIQDQFLFKKTLLQVWKMIASHRPMDLTTLKRNLSKGRIHTMAEFQRDLMLMFQNAVMYNDSDHHIYHMAVEMQREVLEQIQVLSTWLDKRKDLSSLE